MDKPTNQTNRDKTTLVRFGSNHKSFDSVWSHLNLMTNPICLWAERSSPEDAWTSWRSLAVDIPYWVGPTDHTTYLALLSTSSNNYTFWYTSIILIGILQTAQWKATWEWDNETPWEKYKTPLQSQSHQNKLYVTKHRHFSTTTIQWQQKQETSSHPVTKNNPQKPFFTFYINLLKAYLHLKKNRPHPTLQPAFPPTPRGSGCGARRPPSRPRRRRPRGSAAARRPRRRRCPVAVASVVFFQNGEQRIKAMMTINIHI